MGANPRLQTLGDMVYAKDAQAGDILVLDDNLTPVWDDARVADHLDSKTATIADLINALVAAGLMKA